MNYSFIIRKAVPADASAIQEIMQESFKKYMEDTGVLGTMEALEESASDIERDIETIEVYIALIDNIAVGSVRLKTLPDNSAYISRFGVKLQYHNIGIGKALMNLVDKMLIASSITGASLHTASKHRDLVRFYYGRGFYIDSTTKDRGYIRALMVKDYENKNSSG